MPNVVSAIDGTSHEIQIPSNEPQQKTYFQPTKKKIPTYDVGNKGLSLGHTQ